MLLSAFVLSNTVAQITRLDSLESDNQGSFLIISGDTPRFFSPKDPSRTKKFNFFVRLGAPDTRGFLCRVVYGSPNYASLLRRAESSCCKKNKPNKC
jgi:hypothetical protein